MAAVLEVIKGAFWSTNEALTIDAVKWGHRSVREQHGWYLKDNALARLSAKVESYRLLTKDRPGFELLEQTRQLMREVESKEGNNFSPGTLQFLKVVPNSAESHYLKYALKQIEPFSKTPSLQAKVAEVTRACWLNEKLRVVQHVDQVFPKLMDEALQSIRVNLELHLKYNDLTMAIGDLQTMIELYPAPVRGYITDKPKALFDLERQLELLQDIEKLCSHRVFNRLGSIDELQRELEALLKTTNANPYQHDNLVNLKSALEVNLGGSLLATMDKGLNVDLVFNLLRERINSIPSNQEKMYLTRVASAYVLIYYFEQFETLLVQFRMYQQLEKDVQQAIEKADTEELEKLDSQFDAIIQALSSRHKEWQITHKANVAVILKFLRTEKHIEYSASVLTNHWFGMSRMRGYFALPEDSPLYLKRLKSIADGSAGS